MIDLPIEMLKEMEEDGSTLPKLVIFNNLAECATIAEANGEGKIDYAVIDDNETRVSGFFVLKEIDKAIK